MFLDDELYQIATSVDYTHWSHKTDVLQKMIKCLMDKIEKDVRVSSDDVEVITCIKRCRNHWYNALKKLNKKGIDLNIKEDSFEQIIRTHYAFETIKDDILRDIK